MMDELGRILKEAVIIFTEGLKKTIKTVRIAGVSAEIRTWHLPNICVERYA
jgi:hypothetical protein